ncbi:MAG: PKD domain-containing protein [Vicinamibacterales bacterium]
MKAASRFAFLAALGLSAACTVHGVDVPPLTGPSDYALSVSVTATPDILPQDGFAQSAIVVSVKGPDGKGVPNQSLRLQTAVNGSIQDYGMLSARSAVTNADGRATVVYTAPPPPPSLGGSGNLVSIGVTPVGSNFQTATTFSTDIRLLPPGEVLPPATAPTARFAVSPTPVLAGIATNFDASASCASQTGTCTTAGITSFVWSFGDGSAGTGMTTTHTFAAQGAYTVSLTVTNDRGLSTTTTQTVSAGLSANPTAAFVVTPDDVRVGVAANFNADITTPAPGRRIVQYSWNFGDGTPTVSTSFITQHTYTAPGTYTVVLSVMDDAGQKGTATATVTVTP